LGERQRDEQELAKENEEPPELESVPAQTFGEEQA